MLKYVKAFARDKLDLALINFSTFVTRCNSVVLRLFNLFKYNKSFITLTLTS